MYGIKEFFVVSVGLLMMITAIITAPAFLDFIARGYASENYGNYWFICVLSSLGFVAIALSWGAARDLSVKILQSGGSLKKTPSFDRFQSPDDLNVKKSISFNEPGFRKNQIPESVSKNEKTPND